MSPKAAERALSVKFSALASTFSAIVRCVSFGDDGSFGCSFESSDMCYYYHMNYVSAKEQRVETAWAKKGLGGLRINLLTIVEQSRALEWSDVDLVGRVSAIVWGVLPKREWGDGERLIRETCGLVGVSIDDWIGEMEVARMNEEELRDELGREED